MATQASSLPVSDLEYPVQLAHSFQPGEDRDGGLCLLQYHFKPASAGRFQDGRVCVDSDQQKAGPPATLIIGMSRCFYSAVSANY